MAESGLVLSAPDGLTVMADGQTALLPPLALQAGQRLVLTPQLGSHSKLAMAIARTLASTLPPTTGALALCGQPLRGLSYMALLNLRGQIGYVYGHGGLLANRTVADNIALPLVFRNQLSDTEVSERTAAMLDAFELQPVAASRPHQLDGAQRFRACAARALAGSPALVVVEGWGDFADSATVAVGWRGMTALAAELGFALVVSLPQQHRALEAHLTGAGATTVRWRLASAATTTDDTEPTAEVLA